MRSVWASSCSAFSTFCCTSASSRLRASGPWARGRTAGDGDVVEGLAGRGEEEGLGIREGEGAGGVGVRRDKTFAELGQDDFEGLAEAVEHADALLEGTTPSRPSMLVWAALCILGEGEVGLGIVGMDEEGGAAADVGLEEVHAGVGGVPGLHDDVVELVAEELIDYALVFAVDFEEVGQRAYGGHAVGVLL